MGSALSSGEASAAAYQAASRVPLTTPREVLDRIDEIPEDRMTILFCNTGSLSAQAAFALRVAGRSNGVVMQSGLTGWQQDAAYQP